MMLRVAAHEAYQRGPAVRITGPELDDIALQAANDAMLSLLTKLDSFRGDSKFTTWAYRFVALEVSRKVARHFWRRPSIGLETDEWERLPAGLSSDPLARAIQKELLVALQRAVEEALTDHQRDVFLAVVVEGVPLDSVVADMESNRGAVYKTVFDARRKIRAFLIAHGYIDASPTHE
ncbi:RNA polymerase sigma factor [Leifsonia sp. P73]|uniref:RNA polymerase sigma factor n=1 Tax=Leifsonia sp. P73 TaxID=3423959 RepID=UPI003DA50B4D